MGEDTGDNTEQQRILPQTQFYCNAFITITLLSNHRSFNG